MCNLKRKVCQIILLIIGVLLIMLVLNFDRLINPTVGSVAGLFFEGLFKGDCSQKALEEARKTGSALPKLENLMRTTRLALPFVPNPFNTFRDLSGLKLGIYLHPFQWQNVTPGDEHNTSFLFEEAGVIALRINVYNNSLWVSQMPNKSSMSVNHPFFNVNLQSVVLPEVMPVNQDPIPPDVLAQGNETSVPYGSSVVNMSLQHRVSDFSEKTKLVTDTSKGLEYLSYMDRFLKADVNSSAVYGNDFLLVQEKRPPVTLELRSCVAPLIGRSETYSLPALNNLRWYYWRTGPSAMGGLRVDQYVLQHFWSEEVLCFLSDHTLLHILEALNTVRITLSPPATTKFFPVTSKISIIPANSSILDVYRPFQIPVGGSLAVQVNVRVPSRPEFGKLGNLTVPYMWVNLTVEALPYKVLDMLKPAIRFRSRAIIALGVVGAILTFVGLLAFWNISLCCIPKVKNLAGPLGKFPI